MTHPPQITDRIALERHRARATRLPDRATFLHDAVMDEVEERLSEVNRAFTSPAVVTGFPDLWQRRFPKARIVPDDEMLTLDPGAHDLVIHGLSLHWANDPVGQLIQSARALRRDGLFLGTMFGGQTLHELRAALAEAEVAVTGGLSPRIAPMGEIRDLGALLQRAGLALPVADSVPLTVEYRDSLHLMQDLRTMGETNALTARHKRTLPRTILPRAEAAYRRATDRPEGRIPATFEIIYLTGWAPDESQQKPLRPGSASARLADALGAEEQPLDPGKLRHSD